MSRLENITQVLKKTLEKELTRWKVSDEEFDVNIRKIRIVKGTAVISLHISEREGEEGIEVHADWLGGFCRDGFRGITSQNAEKAVKSVVARAAVIEELGKF